jgi:hypothetical protein
MSFFAPALEGTKPERYLQLNQQLAALIGDERDFVANMANMAALLFHQLPDLNWAGFYLMREGELVLGPFQGKPACIRMGWDALGSLRCPSDATLRRFGSRRSRRARRAERSGNTRAQLTRAKSSTCAAIRNTQRP